MMNDDLNNNFDFSGLRNIVTQEQMAELWSKAEIAKILMKQATQLLEEIRNDVDFYVMVRNYEDN